mgnify:CR=1 FL=1
MPHLIRSVRLLFASRPDALSRCLAVVLRAIETDLIQRADLTRASGARTGAVTVVQRFGSALNLKPARPGDLHMLIPDGVYTFEQGAPCFHEVEPPPAESLERVGPGPPVPRRPRALGFPAIDAPRGALMPERAAASCCACLFLDSMYRRLCWSMMGLPGTSTAPIGLGRSELSPITGQPCACPGGPRRGRRTGCRSCR